MNTKQDCQSGDRQHRLILGVTGSVAAFKAPSIARALRHVGCEVRAAMTFSATQVVGEAALRAVLPERPYLQMWSHPGPAGGEVHIEWAEWAEGILIAPATASCLADLRSGRYDNCVTLLAANIPTNRWFIAPAMSNNMWVQPAVMENVKKLRSWGVTFLGPELGNVASGADGQRLMEPRKLAEAVRSHLDICAEQNS